MDLHLYFNLIPSILKMHHRRARVKARIFSLASIAKTENNIFKALIESPLHRRFYTNNLGVGKIKQMESHENVREIYKFHYAFFSLLGNENFRAYHVSFFIFTIRKFRANFLMLNELIH